jgi:hypothetical protein
MRRAEQVSENLKLSRLLTQRLLEEPALLEQIPEGADVIVLPLDNPELFQANLQHLLALKGAGKQDLVIVVLESTRASKPKLLVKV